MVNSANNEKIDSLTRDLTLMQERYQKLLDAHGHLQMQNSLLEERILSIAEIFSDEKFQLEQELIDAKQEISNFKDTINELTIEKQRYKDDCNLAVSLLHQNPHEFSSTTSEDIQKQLNVKSELIPTSQHLQSPHSIVIPTFPPSFATTLQWLNATNCALSADNHSATIAAMDNLQLAETLFKSNNVHRYPSTQFTCAKCHRTVKCCDISVQTSFADDSSTSRIDAVSHASPNSEHYIDSGWVPFEPHCLHMKVKKYQIGNIRKTHQDIGLRANSIPQMHHV
ncbi:unnamed protein product [Rotaria socialis]|uniref:Uncharacterized protein n=1 Tax=Rotaria socialis TaxID=392032 RepID=A0A820W2C4_9BILA|nr:unnamed protein product [Rotaria socialis]CAF3460748.1 unnamed protein product [Rotaria socialis]CAF3562524.1 unnamed protein product [Rotaria socialis]CAF3565170.1 unnamed protein product [Rotaria socialis]CAF3777155.1 unnamed protein product [Rotaria socialis]